MPDRPTLYILDAYSRIYQVYHAIRDGMTGPAGQPTHAVFGLFRDMLNLARVRKPDYILAAFEGEGPGFRSEVYADYKANRAAMPDDLRLQVPVILRMFQAFGVPILRYDNAEADDVIATVARRAEARGLDVTIMTSDKDARQLIGPHVRILNLRDGKVIDEPGAAGRPGASARAGRRLLALTGDAVDNVPGVPTIGEGYAKKLLQAFGTLDEALKRVDETAAAIGKSRQQKLREHADTARRAQDLVRLREDLPLDLDWEALRYRGYDARALQEICFECGFHGFLQEIGPAEKEPEAAWERAYSVVDTPELLRDFVARLKEQRRFCIDTETTDLDPLRASLVGVSVSWNAGEAYYLPVRGPIHCRVLDPEEVLRALGPILADTEVEKLGQNIKYDMLTLGRAGVRIGGPITDTMILSYLLESGERNHNLDQLSQRLLGHTMIPISDLIGKGKKQLRMDQVEVPRVAEYAGEDADATWRIGEILIPKVREEGLWTLYAEVERPLISILAEMERIGVKVDCARLGELSREFAARLATLEDDVYKQAGGPFNINSGPQLREVLFEKLKLPTVSKTPKGEQSTAQEVLEELAARHPLPALLLQHRQLSKLKSTYLDALPALVHEEDGRIHASFNQSVAATGRLSSSDPNLQNIPVRSEEGKQIRQAFVAPEGWLLVTADYSQIELRVLAHYSGDPAMTRAFELDHDIHRAVAARIFGVAEAAVDESMRRVAKTVNFGVVYGLSAFGLAGRLGIPQAEAAAFIEAYFQEYAGVDRFITSTLEAAQAAGRVETILGRRRPISGIKNTTGRSRNLAERTAVNTVIQGSAADLIKVAMIRIDGRLRDEGLRSRMILQIHDELVFEAPREEVAHLADLVRREMTTALELNVPLKVDLAAGGNWLDVEPIEDGG
ncbi:MAG: DNA polymerase I [Isosphaeraceae bacterium]